MMSKMFATQRVANLALGLDKSDKAEVQHDYKPFHHVAQQE